MEIKGLTFLSIHDANPSVVMELRGHKKFDRPPDILGNADRPIVFNLCVCRQYMSQNTFIRDATAKRYDLPGIYSAQCTCSVPASFWLVSRALLKWFDR